MSKDADDKPSLLPASSNKKWEGSTTGRLIFQKGHIYFSTSA